MARILAIDYGKKRCGLAVTDAAQLVPGGLTTVSTNELLPFLAHYLKSESVERIVMGLPVQPSGKPSENAARVHTAAGQIKRAFPAIPLFFYDERYTSVLAHQAMLAGGLPRMKRRDKALVDEISACIILQDYMQSLQLGQSPAQEFKPKNKHQI